jgi:hypothetical protein
MADTVSSWNAEVFIRRAIKERKEKNGKKMVTFLHCSKCLFQTLLSAKQMGSAAATTTPIHARPASERKTAWKMIIRIIVSTRREGEGGRKWASSVMLGVGQLSIRRTYHSIYA